MKAVLRDPVVITPRHTVRQVMRWSEQLAPGFPGSSTAGVWWHHRRDMRFESRLTPVSYPIGDAPRERLITMPVTANTRS
jgi:IMP dehydrogenase